MFPIQHCSELGDLVLRPDGDGLHHLLRAAAHPRVRGAVPLLGPGPGAGRAEGPQVGDAPHSCRPFSPGRRLKIYIKIIYLTETQK